MHKWQNLWPVNAISTDSIWKVVSHSFDCYFVAFFLVGLFLLLQNSLSLEIVALALLNLFVVWILASLSFIFKPSVFGPDADNFADDPFFAFHLDGLIHDSSKFCFLLFVHVHDNKFVSVHVVGSHFRNTVNDFFFDGEVFVRFAEIKIYERRSDFKQEFVHLFFPLYFKFALCCFYRIAFFFVLVLLICNFYHQVQVFYNNANVVLNKNGLW